VRDHLVVSGRRLVVVVMMILMMDEKDDEEKLQTSTKACGEAMTHKLRYRSM
jgi:hypothetical protein